MRFIALLAALTFVACTEVPDLTPHAERYMTLALAVGEHDPDYVDAYYGPAGLRDSVRAAAMTLPDIGSAALGLSQELEHVATPRDSVDQLRLAYLRAQVRSMMARVAQLSGQTMPFDEESRLTYDATAPHRDATYYQGLLDELEGVLPPGPGTVSQRVERYRQRFVIQPARLDTVFRTAVAACRSRMLEHTTLPAEESFTIEYVTNQPWSGYNWYQGNYRSIIQVNTDLPIFIDRAIDLACHEGYPGHHAYNVLLEQHLVNGRGWIEYQVYPLFSPQSLIAEGSANYGIAMAFPGATRWQWEAEHLFPLAGLPGSEAEQYYRIQTLVGRLSHAGNEAARRYLDGEITAELATDWLVEYALMAPERATQRIRFIERYRSYVINYNLGMDLVAAHVEAVPDGQRWARFLDLLSTPRIASTLR
ncbi:MAG: hypothetical protein WD934_07000 [Gemmatimonadales bacterium]